jgi:hypothetical protein
MVALTLALTACEDGSSAPDEIPPPVVVASPSPSQSPTPEPSPSPVPSPTPQPTPEPTPDPTPTPEPLPDITINIVGMTFSPSAVTAKVGQRIVWKNRDTQTHTATANSGEFATGFIDPGGQASAVIQSVGEFAYYCSVHTNMTATVTGEK